MFVTHSWYSNKHAPHTDRPACQFVGYHHLCRQQSVYSQCRDVDVESCQHVIVLSIHHIFVYLASCVCMC